ncbi:hypothetical protein B0H11DRAFT_2195631 [Mycena galericulata]|nr:hypothetical protein B0H11DRAFT_2195631 [Mycena galericulata]
MDTIPPELIESIFRQVTDTDTLKACALVASIFREPSQRILLRSVTLGYNLKDKGYQTVSDILQKSPHIASYIRILCFYLPMENDVSPGVDCLPALLCKFTHISWLVVMGEEDRKYSWDNFAPGIADSICNLIRQPSLEGLYLIFIQQLPLDVLALAFSSVTTLILGDVSGNGLISPPPNTSPMVPTVENLIVFPSPANDVGTMLVGPTFAPCMGQLRNLRVKPNPEYGSDVISAAADSVEEIFFDCEDLDIGTLNAPPCTAYNCLRFAAFRLDFQHRDAPWFVETMRSLLMSPVKEIIIEYIGDKSTPEICSLSQPTMDTLNDIHHSRGATFPRIRWGLYFPNDDGRRLKDFTAALEQGLPKAYKEGKLSTESLPSKEGVFTWPSGTPISPI